MSIPEFYAVTTSGSVYLVSGLRDAATGNPVITKVAANGSPEKATVRRERDSYPRGYYVGILYGLLCRFGGKRERPLLPIGVDPKFLPWRSSPIAALFVCKEKAIECSMSDQLELYDLRWRVATDATLEAIGKKHPVFIISDKPFQVSG